jgi:hypothetical protein
MKQEILSLKSAHVSVLENPRSLAAAKRLNAIVDRLHARGFKFGPDFRQKTAIEKSRILRVDACTFTVYVYLPYTRTWEAHRNLSAENALNLACDMMDLGAKVHVERGNGGVN